MTEAEYGVGIKNRFAFLDGDDDDDNANVEVVAAPAPVKVQAAKPAGNKGQQGSKPAKPDNKPINNANRNVIQKDRPANTGRNPGQTQDDRRPARNNETDDKRRDNRYGQGNGEDRRRNYPDRHGNNTHQNRNQPRRDGGGGRANGDGTERTQDKRDNEANGTEKNTDVDAGIEGGEEEGQKLEGDEQDVEVKAEEKTLTLAEWKALQAPREKPVYNIRKPGEGEVATKLGKLVLKKKEDDFADLEPEEYEHDEAYYPQRAGKMKLISDVGFNTGYQKRRGGGARGGPGGAPRTGDGGERRDREPRDQDRDNSQGRPRGGPRPRGGHQYQRPAQAPRIDDAADFPTLG